MKTGFYSSIAQKAGSRNAPALIGVGCLLTAIICSVVVLRPLQTHLHELNLPSQVTVELADRDSIKAAEPLSVSEQLTKFYRHFPKRSAVPETLDQIHEAAVRHDLVLEQGDYLLLRDKESPLIRYQASFPVHGTYPDTRRFLAEILTQMPNLALTGVTLSRQQISDRVLDVQLKFTLYVAE